MKITEDQKIAAHVVIFFIIIIILSIVFHSCKSTKDSNCDAYGKIEKNELQTDSL